MTIKRIVRAVLGRLPAHANNRAEEWLLGRRDFEQLETPRQSALTVICDDGELRDLDIVEILTRHGVKGVFAVSPDLIGRPGFLSYEQLRNMRSAGHEIAFHGTTHDPFTGFPDAGTLRTAIDAGVARMRAEGLGTPTTLIYPFGRHNRAVRQTVAPFFDCAFTTWFGINQGSTNRLAIRRVPFGAYTGRLPATEQWYRNLIHRCAAGNCWPALMLHPAAAGHTEAHNELLSRLISHTLEMKMPVRTVAAHMADSRAAGAGAHAADLTQGG